VCQTFYWGLFDMQASLTDLESFTSPSWSDNIAFLLRTAHLGARKTGDVSSFPLPQLLQVNRKAKAKMRKKTSRIV